MTRASLGVWAGAGLAILLTGCSANELVSGLLVGRTGPDGERIVYGSLEAVAQSTQGTLTQLGLVVNRKDEVGVVRLASTTRSGAHFDLVLTSERTYQGERVHVRFEWQDRRDDEAAVQILAQLGKQAAH